LIPSLGIWPWLSHHLALPHLHLEYCYYCESYSIHVIPWCHCGRSPGWKEITMCLKYGVQSRTVILYYNLIIIIIICDTYKALPRTHAVKALLPIHFSKKPSFQLHLEGLIVLNWHEMLWQLVPQSCCTNRKTPVTIRTSGSVDMQLFAACGTGLPGASDKLVPYPV
jgi:hypothetical protein